MSSMRLSTAQCETIERAHANDGMFDAETTFHATVYGRQTAVGLVAAGLAEFVRDEPYAKVYRLTDKARAEYATNGQIYRAYRCGNPVCCGKWQGDDPDEPPTHGSCPVCCRWVRVDKTGRMGYHTMQPHVRCSGVGAVREGASV